MANAGKAMSRTKLLANVWEYGFDPGTKIVDVYIRYLRSKVDVEGEKPLIPDRARHRLFDRRG